jgi:hypothetical protein
MIEIEDLPIIQRHVIEELRLLQVRLPEWRRAGPYADHLRPLEPLERREAERLDRLLRHERAAAGERNRDRMLRERHRPWSEDERWTLRKRVWSERRDRERELLAQREQTLLEREQELARLGEQFERWLAEIRHLEPGASDWCAEQARLSAEQGVTPELLDAAHQRRRHAAERHAHTLLARDDVRAALGPGLRLAQRDAIAQALMALLSALDELPPPIVVAAILLMVERTTSAGLSI